MSKRFLISLLLLLILSTYYSTAKFNNYFNLDIKKIILENNEIMSENELNKNLSFLYGKNLFFITKKSIERKINQDSFIEKLEIKKIYPNKLKIKVYEKKPIFILQNKKKKYYYTDSDKILDYIYIEKFKNLPLVFGRKADFELFYNNLKKINFPIGTIKSFYLFESGRWDLKTQDNKTIKLPSKNYDESLKNYISITDKDIFKKYIIFDYRINGQLILK
tara:strand:+ start:2694 stop:3353 length:660 start_codon:yes stop_codon:yes gene_type:complete